MVSYCTWRDVLSGADVIHFIDSNTSLSNLVNGWSRKEDTCRLVGAYWQEVASLKAFVWIERVESKSNVADGPTKGRFDSMVYLEAQKVDPVVTALFESATHL